MDIDESTDGPDLKRAQSQVENARIDRRRTDQVVKEANVALQTLRGWHEENHFVEKLRVVIRGVPS